MGDVDFRRLELESPFFLFAEAVDDCRPLEVFFEFMDRRLFVLLFPELAVSSFLSFKLES